MGAEIGQHAGILGALAREEKRELPPFPAQGLSPVIKSAGIANLSASGVSKPALDGRQVRDQLDLRRGHDTQPGWPCRLACFRVEREREIPERRARPVVQSLAEPGDTFGEAGLIVGGQQKGFGIPFQSAPGAMPSAEAACSSSTA